jgi:TRAP transporter TAXI family solute receptor
MSWYQIKEWLIWLVLGIFVVSSITWVWQKGQKNETITIATASKGGYYYEFGLHLKKELEHIAGDEYDIELLVSKGSVDNRSILLKSGADFGILASGSVSLDNLFLISPLWKDFSHIVVRKDSEATSLADFSGKKFILGKQGSGYRAQAIQLMNFFNIDITTVENNDVYFKKLLDDDSIEGAIVTTGLLNPDLRKVLATGQFKLMPLTATDGFAFNNIFHSQDKIPAGVYPSFNGPLPEQPLNTISTLAVMASNTNVSDEKVTLMLQALQQSSELRSAAPVLVNINPTKQATLKLLDMHPVSEKFFNPNFGLNLFSDALETLAKFKEIIILVLGALLVAIYMLNNRKRTKMALLTTKVNHELFEILDELLSLDRTLQQVGDIRLLRQYQGQILTYKQRIVQLARSSANGEIESGSVYLTAFNQCSDLASFIALKLAQNKAN